MRAKTLQIHWHNKLPVFSVDFQPVFPFRLATCGGDEAVRLWKVDSKSKENNPVEFLAGFVRHAGGVNCVRWSPNGELLASAGDDGSILIWKLSSTSSSVGTFGGDPEDDCLESWVVLTVLLNPQRCAIYDLAWSPDGEFIASASNLDNSVNIYEISSRKLVNCVKSHTHFVQGVAWDPLNQFIASQSSDRSVHIHTLKRGKDLKLSTINKSSRSTPLLPMTTATGEKTEAFQNEPDISVDNLQAVENTEKTVEKKKFTKLYQDETFVTFFRRLCFSPDGSLLFAPTGVSKSDELSVQENCTHIYARNMFQSQPIACFPGYSRPATVVKCSPKLYKLRDESVNDGPFRLPYRILIAVGTKDTVLVYDTQKAHPIIHLSNFHYSAITDIAWSFDGEMLLISSNDGFCSLVCFDQCELGEVYEEQKQKKTMETEDISDMPSTPQVQSFVAGN